ncbi:MAG TPA: hypothetical protein PKD00_00570 [Burkholderiales bacterium]|nr:hypothetical protein [Burkholderiales bacterium]
MADEKRTERAWVKYKDLLVIPLETVPIHFGNVFTDLEGTLSNYVRYINETGTMPINGNTVPEVLLFHQNCDKKNDTRI